MLLRRRGIRLARIETSAYVLRERDDDGRTPCFHIHPKISRCPQSPRDMSFENAAKRRIHTRKKVDGAKTDEEPLPAQLGSCIK